MKATATARAALALAFAGAATAAAGCGEGDDSPRAASLPVTVTEPSRGRLVYRAPRSVAAGLVRITLTNRARGRRKAQLFRIDGNRSIAQARRVGARLPRWFRWEGGVGVTAPGRTASVTQRLRPGRYFITDTRGAKARVAPLTVTGEDEEPSLPGARASIEMKEYSFTASDLRAGTNSIELSNDGLEPHHAVVAPVRPGASVAQLRRFLRGSGPIPVGEVANLRRAVETSVLEGGQRQTLSMRLSRGKYALLCFVPDRSGGPAHVVKGMVDEVTVR